MNHGIENTHENQRVCRCHRCNDWVVKYWKHFYFYANAVFHRTVICTVAMSFYKMELPGKNHLHSTYSTDNHPNTGDPLSWQLMSSWL